jgi:hypothetical protein
MKSDLWDLETYFFLNGGNGLYIHVLQAISGSKVPDFKIFLGGIIAPSHTDHLYLEPILIRVKLCGWGGAFMVIGINYHIPKPKVFITVENNTC